MLEGTPRFRTVGYDLDVARAERRAFVEAARWGVIAAAPRLRFGTVAEWWVGRFARKVTSGERRERTLELHRYRPPSNPAQHASRRASDQRSAGLLDQNLINTAAAKQPAVSEINA
jgi:hypothetical protein